MSLQFISFTKISLSAWFKLLLAYPVFWQGKEETLIGLLWSLDSNKKIQEKRDVALLCTHLNMVNYVADVCHASEAQVLNVLICRYCTLSEAEEFQDRVNLAVNAIC